MNADALTVRALGKRYSGRDREPELWALRDVAFEVPRGGALAVVGENGSGKSTLLDLLMGVTRPSAGSVDLAGPTASLLELGAGFFVELTGRENAVQMGLLSGLSRSQATALAGAAYAAAEVLTHVDADGGSPTTLGATVEISAPGQPVRRQWGPHPSCGCRGRGKSRVARAPPALSGCFN